MTESAGSTTCPSLSVLGVRVDSFESYEQSVEQVARTIAVGPKAFWVAINPQKVYRAMHDRELYEAIDQADVRICDGVGVAIAASLLHGRKIKRCTGCDLFFHLIPVAAARGWRVYLLGASPETNRMACHKLREQYPGLKIVGHRDGYFEDSREVIAQINHAQPDLLFVAMGSPKQELWIARHRGDIQASLCLGVGGTFDVAAGAVRRAPWLFRQTGTEFLYQLVTQPSRWRRQIVYFPYMLHVAKEFLKRKSAGPASARSR